MEEKTLQMESKVEGKGSRVAHPRDPSRVNAVQKGSFTLTLLLISRRFSDGTDF